MIDGFEREKALLADPQWRLSNLYMIKDKSGQKIQFQPNWAQNQLIDTKNLNIILKARQLGVTTLHALRFLDQCLFTPNTHAAIIADAKVVAKEIFVDKVKFAYDNLHPSLLRLLPANRDNANELRFANGSVFRVGTSMRGGTSQYLHITEFAKICQENPKKAAEIVSGALNTVQAGQFITIESTARGRDGHFYQMCREAISLATSGGSCGVLDWRFWFFPWYLHPEYALDEDYTLTIEMEEYFQELESKGIGLNDAQKCWYVKKLISQGEYMKREYPSTPEESFENANEGLIFGKNVTQMRQERRICHLPYDDYARTFSVFDIGWNDETAIWVFQVVGKEIHFIDYYENRLESVAHYANWLKNKPYHFQCHYLPFDAKAKRAETGKCYADFARDAGLKTSILKRVSNELVGIELARSVFPRCFIDEKKCAQGIRCIDNFRKEWNEKLTCYRDKSVHDWASHGAKAFIYACQAAAEVTGGAGLTADQWKAVRDQFF